MYIKSSNDNHESKELIEKEFIKASKEKTNKKSDVNDFYNSINLPIAEKEKCQNEFNECFSKLNSTDLAIIDESISKCISLAQYDIIITSKNLEDILILAFNLGRENELYNKALLFASKFCYFHRTSVIEIIDSEIIAHYMELLRHPMSNIETKFFVNFFSSTFDVVKTANDIFHFIGEIGEILNDPSISANDFENLISIVISIIENYPEQQVSDISLYFLNKVVKKFIFSENNIIFGEVCHLYMIMLLDTLKNEILQFMVESNVEIDGQPNLEDYLLQRIPNVNKQIYREYILDIFVNFSCGPTVYTKILYNRGFLEKFLFILHNLIDESCITKMLKTMQNLFDLGIETVLEIASSSFTDVALKILNDGTLSAKIVAINYICAMCKFSDEPNIQDFLIRSKIIKAIMDFSIIESPKIWTPILFALECNKRNVLASGFDEENIFEHPLFKEIDLNSLYQMLCTIVQTIDGYLPQKKEDCKNIYMITLDFLSVVEPIVFNENPNSRI